MFIFPLYRIINYFREAKIELKKTIWPTRREAVTHTLSVIAITVAFGIFFAIVDYFLTLGLEGIITR